MQQRAIATELGAARDRAQGEKQLLERELTVLRGDWQPESLHRLSLEQLASIRQMLSTRLEAVVVAGQRAQERVQRLAERAAAAGRTDEVCHASPSA